MIERNLYDLAARFDRLGSRSLYRVHCLVIRGIYFHPVGCLVADHLIRKDRALHDVHDRPAASIGGLRLAFHRETHVSGNHDEHCGCVGMHTRYKFRTPDRTVVGGVLFRIENDLFLPATLACKHRFQVGEFPQRTHWRLIYPARGLLDIPELGGPAFTFATASAGGGVLGQGEGDAYHGGEAGDCDLNNIFHRSSPNFYATPRDSAPLHRIAGRTKRFEVAFFHNDPPIELSPDSVMFRAKASMSRTEENEARRYTEVVCELAAVLLRHIKPMPLKVSQITSKVPAEAARETRSLLSIAPSEPIPHLLREIEKSGVLVLALPTELEGRDALSVWVDEVKMPVIALSRNRPGDRIRLSAGHEWGHIVLKHSKRLHAKEEREAYEYSAELSLPETAMRREMTSPITLSTLAKLKSRWRMSMQALIRRGQDLGIITDGQSADLYTQLSAKGWRKREPVEIPEERPRLVRQLTELAYGNNWSALADELGFKRNFIQEILEGYEPKSADDRTQSANVVAIRKT
jgi:Zn-dependent peptidase ImmA (M78 family)